MLALERESLHSRCAGHFAYRHLPAAHQHEAGRRLAGARLIALPSRTCPLPSVLLQATVREAARDYKKLTAVPKELAQREAELESKGYQVEAESVWLHRIGAGCVGDQQGTLARYCMHTDSPASLLLACSVCASFTAANVRTLYFHMAQV